MFGIKDQYSLVFAGMKLEEILQNNVCSVLKITVAK
jgi:hypothetical protein